MWAGGDGGLGGFDPERPVAWQVCGKSAEKAEDFREIARAAGFQKPVGGLARVEGAQIVGAEVFLDVPAHARGGLLADFFEIAHLFAQHPVLEGFEAFAELGGVADAGVFKGCGHRGGGPFRAAFHQGDRENLHAAGIEPAEFPHDHGSEFAIELHGSDFEGIAAQIAGDAVQAAGDLFALFGACLRRKGGVAAGLEVEVFRPDFFEKPDGGLAGFVGGSQGRDCQGQKGGDHFHCFIHNSL